MRKIIFRGRDNKNKWHYGFYYQAKGIHYIVNNNGVKKIVDGETVSQSTGLLDKNGTLIFEYDIIQHPTVIKGRKKATFIKKIVQWETGCHRTASSIELNPIMKEDLSIFNTYPMFHAVKLDPEAKEGSHGWSAFSECEVLGNKFDNKLLLIV